MTAMPRSARGRTRAAAVPRRARSRVRRVRAEAAGSRRRAAATPIRADRLDRGPRARRRLVRHRPSGTSTELLQVRDELLPAACKLRLDVLEDDLARHLIQLDVAAGREEREPVRHVADEFRPTGPGQGSISDIEPKVGVWCPVKSSTVKHGLPSVQLSPRPSCWRQIILENVKRQLARRRQELVADLKQLGDVPLQAVPRRVADRARDLYRGDPPGGSSLRATPASSRLRPGPDKARSRPPWAATGRLWPRAVRGMALVAQCRPTAGCWSTQQREVASSG